jgi:hypothetical protein
MGLYNAAKAPKLEEVCFRISFSREEREEMWDFLLTISTTVGITDSEVRTDSRVTARFESRIVWRETREGTIHGMAERISELQNSGSISESGGSADISREIIT